MAIWVCSWFERKQSLWKDTLECTLLWARECKYVPLFEHHILTSQLQVQLTTTHDISLTLPSAVVTSSPAASASKILALIENEEGKYQSSLNETYHEMGEKTFKGLRRALPLTRQKLDWDKVGVWSFTSSLWLTFYKVLGYKLGAELSASKGVFGNS